MKELFQAIGESLLSWSWAKKFLYWIVMSAGTGAECAFLIASLYVTINASVHPFILLFLSEQTTVHLTQLATVAYVALPEAILSLAIVTTLSHIRVYLYSEQKDNAALTWAILYGIPTVLFISLSLYTIGCSMLSINFQLPSYMIVARGLAGYWYGLVALLYSQLGTPQECDRLQEKDTLLEALRQEKDAFIESLRQDKDAAFSQLQQHSEKVTAQLHREIERIQHEFDAVYKEKETVMQERSVLYTALTQSSEDALQAYGDSVIEWFNGLDKTVDIDDIAAHTGINKRRLQTAIDKGELRVRGTNKGRVWVPSLREYLIKNAPKSSTKERDTGPILHIVNG